MVISMLLDDLYLKQKTEIKRIKMLGSCCCIFIQMECNAMYLTALSVPFVLRDACSAPGLAEDSDLWEDPGDMSESLYYMDP